LANTKKANQALKRARQSEKRRVENKWQMSRMGTYIKRVLTAIESKNQDLAKTEYRDAASIIDRLVTKGLIHKNKANRHKSRLNKRLKALETA